jgi:hypothetical protein
VRWSIIAGTIARLVGTAWLRHPALSLPKLFDGKHWKRRETDRHRIVITR